MPSSFDSPRLQLLCLRKNHTRDERRPFGEEDFRVDREKNCSLGARVVCADDAERLLYALCTYRCSEAGRPATDLYRYPDHAPSLPITQATTLRSRLRSSARLYTHNASRCPSLHRPVGTFSYEKTTSAR